MKCSVEMLKKHIEDCFTDEGMSLTVHEAEISSILKTIAQLADELIDPFQLKKTTWKAEVKRLTDVRSSVTRLIRAC